MIGFKRLDWTPSYAWMSPEDAAKKRAEVQAWKDRTPERLLPESPGFEQQNEGASSGGNFDNCADGVF